MAASPRAARRLDPDAILDTVVYVQAAVRRFLVEEPRQLAGITPTLPAPPVAVALFRCRRALRPEEVDVEAEAMAVAAIICGREGLTLWPLVSALERYACLPEGHPVLEMLRERFGEVALDAEEDIMRCARASFWPSEGRRSIAEARRRWGAPERLPWGGEELFPRLEEALEGLRQNAEERLTSELPLCRTMRGLDAMAEAIDVELGDVNTALKGRVRAARMNYRQLLDLTAHTAYSWPPVGAFRSLASAARWFTSELGEDNPVAEDFLAAVKRARKGVEKSAIEELKEVLQSLTEIRVKLNTDPPPPKLLAEGYREELDERMLEALSALEQRWQELGAESREVLRLAKAVLLPGPFLQRVLDDVEEAASALRRPSPPPRPGPSAEEAEERLTAAVRILQLLPEVEAYEDHATLAAALRAEFSTELEAARPWVGLLEAQVDDDGWHRPPDFAIVDQPLAPPRPPPTPPRQPTPVRPATPPPAAPDVSCSMRLHGVTLEEAQQNSETLVLEKLALVIAKECGIPREWISNVALLAPPAKAERTEPPEADACSDDADGTLGHDTVGVGSGILSFGPGEEN